MGNAFHGMLDDGKSFSRLNELQTAVDWYKYAAEARKQPGNVQAMVIDKIVEKLLEAAHLEFIQLTFDQVNLKAKGKKAGNAGYLDLHGLEADLPPIKPNIRFVILVNGVAMRSDVLEISFEIDSKVSLEELKLYYNGDGRLKGKSLAATFTLFLLAKMRIGQRKKKIGEGAFRLEGFELGLSAPVSSES